MHKQRPSFFQSRLGLLTVVGVVSLILILYSYSSDDNDIYDTTTTQGTRTKRNIEKVPECDAGQVEALSWEPRVFTFRSFLSAAECKRLIELGEALGLEESRVVASSSSKSTASTTGKFLSPETDKILQDIDRRVSEWAMIPPEHGESGYLLKYEQGQQYQPHYDYFEGEAGARHLAAGGQRVVTVIMFLSEPEQGGETVFPLISLTARPKAGDAMLIHNTLPNGSLDPKTLRGTNPIISGSKYCFTKWLRERPYPHSWYLRDEQ